jgi:transcriptional regulator with XRE-family HTH domain
MDTLDDQAERAAIAEQTGHSRHIRAVLRAAREAEGLTQQQVADRITSRLNLERPLTGAAVSEWERFGRHPPINVMAAWARVLGRRLLVQLDESGGERVSILVRPDVADMCRALDMLSTEDLHFVQDMLDRLGRRR